MAQESTHPSIPQHKDVALCHTPSIPLSTPRIRITKGGMGRKGETTTLPIPSLLDIMEVGTINPTTVCSSNATLSNGSGTRGRGTVGSGVLVEVPGVPKGVPIPQGHVGKSFVLGTVGSGVPTGVPTSQGQAGKGFVLGTVSSGVPTGVPTSQGQAGKEFVLGTVSSVVPMEVPTIPKVATSQGQAGKGFILGTVGSGVPTGVPTSQGQAGKGFVLGTVSSVVPIEVPTNPKVPTSQGQAGKEFVLGTVGSAVPTGVPTSQGQVGKGFVLGTVGSGVPLEVQTNPKVPTSQGHAGKGLILGTLGSGVPVEVPSNPKVLMTQRQPGDLVLGGEEVPKCVILDAQGNVIMQDVTTGQSTGAPAHPYLVEQPILVQVGAGVEQGSGTSGPALGNSRKGTKEVTNKGRKLESRWKFKVVNDAEEMDKNTPPSDPPQDPLSLEEENEGDCGGRPRRKSAKRARLRWKSIGEVEVGSGGGGGGRSRRPAGISKDRTQQQKGGDVKQDGSGGESGGEKGGVGEEVPIWASGLSSVRVVDGQWVVGVAASNEVLQEALEAHSRSVLCDYIKSHPSCVEQRHRTRCQVSRILWHKQRVQFDGVPFMITSSNDLRCAFAMNYKIKRKSNKPDGNGKEKNQGDGTEYGTDGGEQQQQVVDGGGVKVTNGEGGHQTQKDTVPKKKYKNIWFTSCPARITVKVLVKYPGFAVGLDALDSERKTVMKALRRDLAQGVTLEREELYHVTLPLHTLHNHPLQGQSRSIHPMVDSKVVALLKEGVTAPKEIQRTLEFHVESVTAGDLVRPHPEDRAFHPRLKDIANLVYTRCRQMGISSRRRQEQDQSTLEVPNRKRRISKRKDEERSEDPLPASTLQEAVQTFCTDDCEGAEAGDGMEAQETQGVGSDVVGLPDMVRSQLDTLRNLTYTLQDSGSLQDIYQSLQGLIDQYINPTNPNLSNPALEVSTAPSTFILQDPSVDPMTVTQGTPPLVTEVTVTLQDKEMDLTGRTRGTQTLRQLRPPVAVQCVANMVPTVVSQLPHRPPVTNTPQAHMVSCPAPPPQPVYQTLAPVTQDAPPPPPPPPAPVHLSIPPYFYYVQEVTVPETSQTWTTYTTSS